MKSQHTTEAERELRKIRDAIHDEAMAVGWDKYYADLNKRAGFFFGAFPKRKPVQRRENSSSMREPNAIKEVRKWRHEIQREAALYPSISSKPLQVRETPPQKKKLR